MEHLLCAVISLACGVFCWFARKRNQAPVVISEPVATTTSPTVAHGKDRCYVRFQFLDGHVEVRPFMANDLNLQMIWRRRKFVAAQWTSDGHIYNEVVQWPSA